MFLKTPVNPQHKLVPMDATSTSGIDDLRRAAPSDADAATHLALRLLVGRDAPFSPDEGVGILTGAAERGHPDAMVHLATLRAAGAWMPQNWPEALDLLGKAAFMGSQSARGQLRVLASEPDGFDWDGMRRRISVDSWMTPSAPMRRVWQSPRIWTAEGFVPPLACEWLVSRVRGRMKPALLFDGQRSKFNANRTNSDFVFDIVEADLVLILVRTRVSRLTELPVPLMEPPQIFHYATGQEIKAHYDFLYDGVHQYGHQGGYTGDRLATFLLYLNDDYGGGELDFPKVGYRYRGKTGDGIFFTSKDADGNSDKQSLHAALPVTRNEKWILSQWIHNQVFKG